ncbi:putative type I restriction enzymeP M protein, partial [Haemophilus influenzae]
SAK